MAGQYMDHACEPPERWFGYSAESLWGAHQLARIKDVWWGVWDIQVRQHKPARQC